MGALFNIALVGVVSLFVGGVSADVNYWVGGDGAWEDSGNWSLGRVPDGCDVVVFDLLSDSEHVRVDVSSGIEFEECLIESGSVTLSMSDEGVLFHRSEDECSDLRVLSVGGEGASLGLEGGALFDEHSFGDYEIRVGYSDESEGELVISGTRFGEAGRGVTFDIVLGFEGGEHGGGAFQIESDIDLRNSEIDGNGVILVSDGVEVSLGSIGFDGELMLGRGSIVNAQWVGVDQVWIEEGGELRVEYLNADGVHVEGEEVVISAQNGIDSVVYFDSDALAQSDDGLLLVHDVEQSDQVRVGLDVQYWDGDDRDRVYPEIGSVLSLARFGGAGWEGSRRAMSDEASDFSRISFRMDLYEEYDHEQVKLYVVNSPREAHLLVGAPMTLRADLNFDGRVDYFDLSLFVELYVNGSPWANMDGVNGLDRDDVLWFVGSFD